MGKINKILILIALAGICFLWLGIESAYAVEISAGVTYTDLDLSGKVKSNTASSNIIEIDLEDDLSIGGDEPTGVIVKVDGQKHHLWVEYASLEFTGSKTLTQAIDFQGKTYSATAQVDSKLEYDLLEVQYHYDLLDMENVLLGLSLAPLFKVTVYDASVNLKATSVVTHDETYSETLPLPTIGALGRANLTGFLNLTAQVNGIGYSGNTYIEYKAMLELKPVKGLSLGLGYKGTQIDYSDGDDLLDIETNGLFAQAVLSYKF